VLAIFIDDTQHGDDVDPNGDNVDLRGDNVDLRGDNTQHGDGVVDPNGDDVDSSVADRGCLEERNVDDNHGNGGPMGEGDGTQAPPSHAERETDEICAVRIEEIKIANEFSKLVKTARLGDVHDNLDPGSLERLRNPPQECLNITDPDLRLSLDIYLGTGNADEDDITLLDMTASPTHKRKPSIVAEQDTMKKAKVADAAEEIDVDGQENMIPDDTGKY
jgi:hypothetical protein